jgi:hypothetical protein
MLSRERDIRIFCMLNLCCLLLQLKILACNVSGGELQGQIMVNGTAVHPKVFKNQSAVVWQSDVLLASATVSTTEATCSSGSASTSCSVHSTVVQRVFKP